MAKILNHIIGISASALLIGTACLVGVQAKKGLDALHNYDITRSEKRRTKTQNVIGDPNAPDTNETYIETKQGRAYYTIDGKSIEEYVNERNK
ncbi:hypothetical protein HN935_02220 [archaeon]|jgi:hypothetical protein|nr:hypothetical protein [archaeon]